MSTKSLQPSQGRRTPLSIGTSVTNNKQQHHKHGNNKGNHNSNKSETKAASQSQKFEQITDKKESDNNSHKDNKKQNQNNAKNNEEKPQNGVSKANNNGNAVKDKGQNTANPNLLNVRINLEKADLTPKQQKEEKSSKDEKKDTASKKEKEIEITTKAEVSSKDTVKQKEKETDVVKQVLIEAGLTKTVTVTPVIEEVEVVTTEVVVSQKNEKVVSANIKEKIANTPSTEVVEEKSETTKKDKTPIKSNIVTVMDVDTEAIIAPKPSPVKESPIKAISAGIIHKPAATSTPGKILFNNRLENASSQPALPSNYSPPRTFGQISGRRSIRTFNNLQDYRESYRRINTELDVSNCTVNTSLNVTVGSEIPNTSTFSFFGRGRKRDRTPPQHSQSAMEVQIDGEFSPPKRARIDMHGLLSVVSSPLTLLRTRFSRATLQTPVKLATKLDDDENAEVQNLSGNPNEIEKRQGQEEASDDLSEAQVIEISDDETKERTAKVESEPKSSNVDADIIDEVVLDESKERNTLNVDEENPDSEDHIDVKEISLVDSVGEPVSKNKRCQIM